MWLAKINAFVSCILTTDVSFNRSKQVAGLRCWSSGQRPHLLLHRSELKSCWRLKVYQQKDENHQKRGPCEKTSCCLKEEIRKKVTLKPTIKDFLRKNVWSTNDVYIHCFIIKKEKESWKARQDDPSVALLFIKWPLFKLGKKSEWRTWWKLQFCFCTSVLLALARNARFKKFPWII